MRDGWSPRAAALLASLVAVVTAGCGGPAAVATRPAPPGATSGGTLRVGITAPGSIDPSDAYEPMGNLVISTICEPLIAFDPATGAARPGIASSWQVTASGKDITVELRKHVRYSDGRTVTADDVAAELSRVASQDNASYEAGVLAPISGYDTVHGDKQTDSSVARTQLSGVHVISSTSLEISLTRQDADFVRVLGSLIASPVPRADVARNPTRFETDPICAGPYKLDAPYTPGATQISVSRSPDYYRGDGGHTLGGAGYPDHIVFKIYPKAAAADAALAMGAVDVAPVDEVSLPTVATVAPAADLVAGPSGSVEYVGLPDGSPTGLFANPAVRQALSEALDRVALIKAAFGGGRLPATGFVPPSLGPPFATPACGSLTPAGGDVSMAQATLAAAHVSLAGRTVTYSFDDEYGHRQLAQAVAAQWQAAFGLHVKLVGMPWDQYLARATSTGGFDGPFREGWVASFPSADEYLYPLFHSSEIGTDNFAHLTDRDIDDFLDRGARRADSDADRALAYASADRQLCGSMPMIPIAFGQVHYLVARTAVGSAITGWTDLTSGEPDLRELYLRRGGA